MTTDHANPLAGEIIHHIRRLMQAGERYTKELNKTYQVSAPQLNCLMALKEHGSLPLSRIARLIMVNSSTVTGIIDRLEQKGLVARKRNSPDRRVIFIELTDAGRQLAQSAPPPFQQKIVEGLNRLSDDDLEEILRSVSGLTRMLDVHGMDVEKSLETDI